MDFEMFGTNIRTLVQMKSFNMSVAVWVGFIALFGIATDDGVVMATDLKQKFQGARPKTKEEVRDEVVRAGWRRIRRGSIPSATTQLALLPTLPPSGRGSDIIIPMAIPPLGGMAVALISLVIVPVLYSWWEERKLNLKTNENLNAQQ